MEPTTTADDAKQEVTFPNGNRATLVEATVGQDPEEILRALGLAQPKALVMIAGGADNLGEDVAVRLRQFFSRGVARAALAAEALIIDGGTQAGVMELMGQGVADRGRKTPLLGVAPGGKVTYPGGSAEGSIKGGAALDPNHSHFVLVEGKAWGDETETMFKLAEILTEGKLTPLPHDGSPPAVIPVIMVLANGGKITRQEALRCVRHGWPLLVLQGSGGVADEIAEAYTARQQWAASLADENAQDFPSPPPFIADAALAEIIADGTLHFFAIQQGTPQMLESELVSLINQRNATRLLERAWRRFATLDASAINHQKYFFRLQLFILAFGLVAVLLVLLQTEIYGTDPPSPPSSDATPLKVLLYRVYEPLRYVIIIVPILISVLLAAANRFKKGNKWILLRASAEAIKREIYRYRTRAALYSDAMLAQQKMTREGKLAERLKEITGQLMTTAVNEASLVPYEGKIPPKYAAAEADDGLSMLTPEAYITLRLEDQRAYFSSKTKQYERTLTRLQWAIYLIGGFGTLLAAIGWELWIALTTALAAAFTTYLEYRQTEYTLIQYNQTATNLENAHNWWLGLSPAERANPVNASLLVDNTEKILESELSGWMQQMQDALAALAAQQAKEAEKIKGEGSGAFLLRDTRQPTGDGAPPPPETPAPPQVEESAAAGDVTASPPAGEEAAPPDGDEAPPVEKGAAPAVEAEVEADPNEKPEGA